jgi:predicted TIM-barrel fold metal-dependent hydrolase
MRTITLEEHVTFPELIRHLSTLPGAHALHLPERSPFLQGLEHQLSEVGAERLKSMDDNGISVQVLSIVGAGAEILDKGQGPDFAYLYNEVLAQKISKHPDRFAALAHLPMTAPKAAADELERTVKEHDFKGALIKGMTQQLFLDDPQFDPILSRAEQLDVPLYLHPAPPPQAVFDAYYKNLPKSSGTLLSLSGFGWHSETALHVLRLILSGVFDLHPKLKLIIGHMGEMLPMMMARCDDKFKVNTVGVNQRSISRTLREQVYVTTSGIFTQPPLTAAIDTFGIDRILFSVDYPFSPNEDGRRFLDSLTLSEDGIQKISHGNADRLLKLS